MFATEADGSVLWSVSYLPFGELRADEEFTLRFPGQWFQSESGLFQNWMRDYDPTTGRYMQADPLGLVDGASVYGYARQNPGRYIDPRGEYIPVVVGAVIGAGVGYYETGCWQGALAGGAVGALAGATGIGLEALGASSIGAGLGTGAGASALSQIMNNEISGICGCSGSRRDRSDLLLDPQFYLTTMAGSLGGMFGGVVGGPSGRLSGWAIGHTGRTVVKDVIAEIIATVTGAADGNGSGPFGVFK